MSPGVRTLAGLTKRAKRMGVMLPQPATLARYGMTLLDWLTILDDQGWRCPIYDRAFPRYVIDHEHVRGWKKMPPAERRLYVRGLVSNGANYFILSRHLDSAERATRVADYLRAYEERRPL